jgi:hypothetical protein
MHQTQRRRKRVVACRALIVVMATLTLTGCLHGAWVARLLPQPDGPPVVGLPPGYDPLAPRPPYDGALPQSVPFDVTEFAFPVALGGVGPIDRSLGPLQYPFACETLASGLGQPLVDNHDRAGVPVFEEDASGALTDAIIGYSQDCLVPTRVEYYYRSKNGDFHPLDSAQTLPDDIVFLELSGSDGLPRRVPFVVAFERGTINRFIYGIAMLADPASRPHRPTGALWNQRLIYYFRGGVGIGRRQGSIGVHGALDRRAEQLADGYAIAYSTGNQTQNHYNMWVAANTASMVKAQFEALYGAPRHTIGIGESGGGVQQYLTAQNRPGLLDALIPIYSYPDMVTQSIWAMDCELLEYYFDVTAAGQERWRRQEERTLVMGLAASSAADNPFDRFQRWSQLLNGRWPDVAPGGTECSLSWRGLTPVANNPHYYHRASYFAPHVARSTHFSHWHDLADIYGVGEDGYAYRTYDNTGVQYGLVALREGALSPAEFLHLNANVGSWKPPQKLRPERLWLLSGDRRLSRLSPWSHHNMQRTPRGARGLGVFRRGAVHRVRVAPRNRAHQPAVEAIYRAGHVFLGNVNLPIIDVRHYLDHELDMHHSFASMTTRLRIETARGTSDNMVIWMAEPPYDPIAQAVALIEEWLQSGRRPDAADDRCWDASGKLIAAGRGVWDGAWNGASEAGACLQRFPIHQSPRNAAGAPRSGDLFQCVLTDIDDAIERGFYEPVDMTRYRAVLKAVFPDGVCDYGRGDEGRPTDAAFEALATGRTTEHSAVIAP